MTVSDKFASVRALLEEHNSVVGKEKPGYVDVDEFLNNVQVSGGTSDDRLKRFSYEDILALLPATYFAAASVKPIVLAKDIANCFRGKDENYSNVAKDADDLKEPKYISEKKAALLSLEKLVDAFDPMELDTPVAKRIEKMANGRRFLVYTVGRSVNVEVTTKLLDELKQGYPERDTFKVDGEPIEVKRFGDLPDAYVPENPLYPGRPLRPDGTCDQLDRSWEGVAQKVRQIVRICLDMGLITLSGEKGRERAHDIFELVVRPDAENKLKERYPKAFIEYNQLAQESKLPTLLVRLVPHQKEAPKAGGSPFDGGRKITLPSPAGYKSLPKLRRSVPKKTPDYPKAEWLVRPEHQQPTHYYTPNYNGIHPAFWVNNDQYVVSNSLPPAPHWDGAKWVY